MEKTGDSYIFVPMEKVELIASIFMKQEGDNVYPCIRIDDQEDGNGNALVGYCTHHSAGTLAEIYRKDNEYRAKEKYEYTIRWKGNTDTCVYPFIKFEPKDYGE